jgi:hypothetical protein
MEVNDLIPPYRTRRRSSNRPGWLQNPMSEYQTIGIAVRGLGESGHNIRLLPPSADSLHPPVIPLPAALYISDELIFESSMRGTTLPQIFHPLGKAGSSEGKHVRGSRSEFANRLAHAARLVPAFDNPPNANFQLTANKREMRLAMRIRVTTRSDLFEERAH